jgi:hypothetical protein
VPGYPAILAWWSCAQIRITGSSKQHQPNDLISFSNWRWKPSSANLSPLVFPCSAGKYREISRFRPVTGMQRFPLAAKIQIITFQFPGNRNREFRRLNREFHSAYKERWQARLRLLDRRPQAGSDCRLRPTRSPRGLEAGADRRALGRKRSARGSLRYAKAVPRFC